MGHVRMSRMILRVIWMGNRVGTMPADECRSVVVHMDIHKREFSSQKKNCSFFSSNPSKKGFVVIEKKV